MGAGGAEVSSALQPPRGGQGFVRGCVPACEVCVRGVCGGCVRGERALGKWIDGRRQPFCDAVVLRRQEARGSGCVSRTHTEAGKRRAGVGRGGHGRRSAWDRPPVCSWKGARTPGRMRSGLAVGFEMDTHVFFLFFGPFSPNP